MTPTMFYGSKVKEEPNGFIEEVYEVLAIIRVCSIKKVDLSANQLKDVSHIWYEQWKDNWPFRVGPIVSEAFKLEFLDRFVPWESTKEKFEEFYQPQESKYKF